MPTTMTSRRRHGALTAHAIRAYLGYALIGFISLVLPFITFYASYLIIPYPKPAVIILQLAPALATKLTLPRLLRHVSPHARSFAIAVSWAVAALATLATPPNVPSYYRILVTALAATASAATEVSVLSQMPHYGRGALAGWGLGTGAGAVVCSILPFFVTIRANRPFRSIVGYIFYLDLVLIVALLLVLPQAAAPAFLTSKAKARSDDAAAEEEALSLLYDLSTSPPGLKRRIGQDLESLKRAQPYMASLFVAFLAQSVIYPGISRAMPTSPPFATCSTFHAAFALTLALGSFCARSTILTCRTPKTKTFLVLSSLSAALILATSTILSLYSVAVIYVAAFCLGFAVGAAYVNTFASAMHTSGGKFDSDADFLLGIIGSGETAGMLLGALIGAAVESQLCARGWCAMAT